MAAFCQTFSSISIHALLAESDISVLWTVANLPLFLSTLSLRRATHYDNYNLHCVEISIHALLAESDVGCPQGRWQPDGFLSTLSLRRATPRVLRHCTTYLFLSTLSLRRATFANFDGFFWWVISIHALLAESDEVSGDTWQRGSNFYPRSPCGERHIIPGAGNNPIRISIHALLAESDPPRRFHYRKR